MELELEVRMLITKHLTEPTCLCNAHIQLPVSYIKYTLATFPLASPVAQMIKNLPVMQEAWVWSLGQEGPLEKGMQPTPVFLPEEFHGQRSLVGYSPWGRKEPDTTKTLPLSLPYAWMHAKSLQRCPTLYDPLDCSLPSSSVHVILQTRLLKWTAMPSRG